MSNAQKCYHCDDEIPEHVDPIDHHAAEHPRKRFDPLWYVKTNEWEDTTDPEVIVKDVEVERAFENTNFGKRDPRDVILSALLKTVGNYATGQTAAQIIRELRLVNGNQSDNSAELTEKGRRYLFHATTKRLRLDGVVT